MRNRLMFVAVAFAMLTFSLTINAIQFEHPDLKKGKKVIGKVLILPAKVSVTKQGVKGNEPLIEESQRVEAALPEIIAQALQERGCTVLENPFSPQALEQNLDLNYALADIQARFDGMTKQLSKKKKDVRKGRFTLGDEVANFNPGASADALVFVRGHGRISTGGKKALAFAIGGLAGLAAAGNRIWLDIAVVDAHTGAILYYAQTQAGGDVVKEAEKMFKPIRNSLKKLPSPTKSKKK